MIRITDKADCCGCSACAAVCLHGAISMVPDALGFLYPEVDAGKCVDCGLCGKVCAFNESYDRSMNLDVPLVYGARHKDPDEVMASRSGAAFISVSDHVLEHGGVVYGAGYEDHFRVVHKRALTREERDGFRGSKYVQSDMGDCFRQVKNDLKEGRTVLFSGTPCQISGLNSYVGNELRNKLYLVDIVCHGVPSPYIWRDYLAYLERKHGSEICRVDFRDKREFGWAAHRESFEYCNGLKGSGTGYTTLFYEHIMFRHSCGKCHFANTVRPGDITLADFWGWEKTDPSLNADDRGISLVFLNTEKGRRLFEGAGKYMDIVPAELDMCIQSNMRMPSGINPYRMKFEEDYVKYGFEYVYSRYGEDGVRYRFRQLKWRMKLFFRRLTGKK